MINKVTLPIHRLGLSNTDRITIIPTQLRCQLISTIDTEGLLESINLIINNNTVFSMKNLINTEIKKYTLEK